MSGAHELWSHHLVAAALTRWTLPDDVVEALGRRQGELIDTLRRAIARRWPDESAEVWDDVLRFELMGAFSSDHVPVRRSSPQAPGSPPLVDHLGLDVYVSMLAALIARKATPMPVSIGLFGEWGSGKSYFMELLRQRVRSLADAAGPYHTDILQLTFNAWHYADTNLWASLAAEFFEQLAQPEIDPVEARRATLREKLAGAQLVRIELETSRRAAEDRTAELRRGLARAAAEREKGRHAFDQTLLTIVTEELQGNRELGLVFSSVADRLGLRGQGEQVLRIAKDVRGMGDDLAATRRLLGRRQILLPFALLVIALAVFALGLVVPDEWIRWFRGGAAAALTAAVTALGASRARARALATDLRQLAEQAAAIEAEVVAGDPRMTKLAGELQDAEATEAVARVQVEEVLGLVADLDRQLVELAPDRRLYRFLAERAASSEYRSQLGIVSLVRRDFEELVRLTHEWRNAQAEEPESAATRPIDRIVLYIDDLDRCEPDQVVDVLQAVHLLLAMDLFVVVVGVDPRWLLRSLGTRYPRVLGMCPRDGTGADTGLRGATPRDYLKKIFQVPFVLPPMDRDDLGRLLRHLARPDGANGGTSQVLLSATPQIEPDGPEAPSAPPQPATGSATPTPLPAEPSSEVADVVRGAAQAITTPITEPELELLGRLSGLVRTPRAATSLFNIYGLLRSTRDLHEGSEFLGAARTSGRVSGRCAAPRHPHRRAAASRGPALGARRGLRRYAEGTLQSRCAAELAALRRRSRTPMRRPAVVERRSGQARRHRGRGMAVARRASHRPGLLRAAG